MYCEWLVSNKKQCVDPVNVSFLYSWKSNVGSNSNRSRNLTLITVLMAHCVCMVKRLCPTMVIYVTQFIFHKSIFIVEGTQG